MHRYAQYYSAAGWNPFRPGSEAGCCDTGAIFLPANAGDTGALSIAAQTWLHFIAPTSADLRGAVPSARSQFATAYSRVPAKNIGFLSAEIIDQNQLTNVELCSVIQAQYFAGIRYTNKPEARAPYTRTPPNNAGYLSPAVVARWKLTPAEIQSIRVWQFHFDHPELADVISRQAYEHRSKSIFSKIGSAASGALKVVSKIAPLVQAGLSMVPGIGTIASTVISAAGAALQGKSLAQIALAAGKGAIPGGPMVAIAVQSAAKLAVAGVQGKNLAKAAANEVLGAAVSLAPGPAQDIIKQAVVAAASGQNVLKSVKGAVVNAALAQVPDPSARALLAAAASGQTNPSALLSVVPGNVLGKIVTNSPGGALAAVVGTINTVKDAPMRPNFGGRPDTRPEFIAAKMPLILNRAVAPSTAPVIFRSKVAHKPLSDRAKAWLRARTGRADVGGLASDGTWLVQSGDTGSKIAQSLTGSANRWTELKAVNPKIMSRSKDLIAKYGFPIYVGDVVYLPAGWVKPVATPATPAVPNPAPTITAPAGDLAAMSVARTELVGWSATDGKNRAGTVDYGTMSDMLMTTWSSRDVFQAASFATWWNSQGATAMATDGQFTQQLADNLRLWTEKRASQAIPAGTPALPTIFNPTPVPAPAPTATATPPAPAPAPAPAPQPSLQQVLTQLPTTFAQALPQLQQALPQLPAATTSTTAASTPSATPGGPPTVTVQTQTATASPATAPPARTPMSDQARAGLTTAAGIVGLIVGPAISKAMFGSAAPPPMPI